MKKCVFLFVAMVSAFGILAQAPNLFNFQSVARNSAGAVIPLQDVGLKVSIIDGSPSGTVEFTETHTAKTNLLGLFSLAIGGGTVAYGSFNNINWSTGSKYLKIELDPTGGANYLVSGTSQLLSVPYALFSGNSSSFWVPTSIKDGIYYEKQIGIGTSSINKDINGVTGNLYPSLGWTGLHLKGALNALLTIEGKERSRLHFASNRSMPNSRNYTIEVSNNFGANNSSYLNIACVNDDLSTKSRGIVLHENGNVGIGGMLYDVPTPKSKLHVTGGDVYIEDVSKGVIMKSPNGKCWRMTIDNSGQTINTPIACPQ